ncbi:sodium/myo-inositol cotransporter-like isoform X2 [Anneissia japonica]|uniref:sodium/myo-inositol cotransporter-like isoform X2 n=1 Tax=Anneissia japonica TaxID=1529436 RepID=UPI0014259B88|nr:sodium/myo-inositol cotransporter-like isoform X2 [Anneissia japonica]
MENRLENWDYVAIVVYVILVLAAGLYSMCRSNRGTVSGYFLAGRYMFWLPVGASLFASNIGSEHFVGLAGSGAAAGIGVAAFEFNACLLLQLLGWVFLPVYIASGVYTLPEYMKKRFGGQRIRVYLACLSLVLYIFTKISVDMYSGALFIQEALGWNLYVSIIILLALTAICTVTGGLAAVIYTDTLQFFIMIIGAVILMVLSFVEVGGYDQLKLKYMQAIPNETLSNPNYTCGYPREDSFQMLRDPVNSDMPWAGFLLGQTPASIWYWCADQMMVQRALAAKSLSHAQGGCIFAGYIKLLPMVLMVIPGMISRVLYPDEVGCASAETCMEVCGSSTGCSNIAYPRIVLGLMPTGLRGVMLAVMLAALMSDLTSIFNSTSTLFTIDVWKIFRIKFFKSEPSVRELMIVGRVIVMIMVGIGIIWIPIIMEMQGGQLFIYIQEIAAYLSPPIAAVYLVALLWPRGNEQGAFWSLMAGLVTGGIRMILDFVWRSPPCWEEDPRPSITAKVHYMYFALLLFWQTVFVNIIVSLVTSPTDPEKVIRTTYWSRFSGAKRLDDFEDDKAEVELDDLKDTDGEVEIVDGRGTCKKGYDWFCGYDDTMKGKQKAQKHREHLKAVTSLEQDPKAKIFLNVNLVVIIGVATFLYIFFSV